MVCSKQNNRKGYHPPDFVVRAGAEAQSTLRKKLKQRETAIMKPGIQEEGNKSNTNYLNNLLTAIVNG